MHASKENAKKAMSTLDNIRLSSSSSAASASEWQTVRDFLEAAARKLPSEEAFAKEKTRSKRYRDRKAAGLV